MDHQGEVVNLQNVGESAQCVGQVDLQEKLCPCRPSELPAPTDLTKARGATFSKAAQISRKKAPQSLEHSVLCLKMTCHLTPTHGFCLEAKLADRPWLVGSVKERSTKSTESARKIYVTVVTLN